MNTKQEILIGDCRELLARMEAKSVHCCITSPPYFGLRDYGVDGQIGLEQTPGEYVTEMVAVFREVRRVLRDDGTLWLNLGDSYAGSWGARGRGEGTNAARPDLEAKHGTDAPNRHGFPSLGVKPKDLIGIPWRVAFALQADGWYLRQDIIWHKPNPMPESVRDRCTKAHEYIFMFSKSPRYHFDADAVREDAQERKLSTWDDRKKSEPVRRGDPSISGHTTTTASLSSREGRNRRSVWTVSTKPFKGTHFATFPPDLIEPCILAGCPPQGTVLDPFGGAGTTGLVAKRAGRNAILCELNPEYAAMARNRIDAPVATPKAKRPANDNAQKSLFDAA